MNASAAGTAAFAFIAFVSLIPPFAWHVKCANIPAILLMFWLMLINIICFINTMIWSGENFSEVYDGQGWCDVTIKLEVGANIGKLCAIACLAMNLYMILCAKHPVFMDSKNWRKKAIDLSICLVFPIFMMAVNYVIQAKRYTIFRYRGCVATYSYTGATIGLYLVWPIVWSAVAAIFAVLTLYKYLQKRKDVKDILLCTNSGLNLKRFARLLIFSLLIIFAMTPLSIYYFVDSVKYIQGPFSWSQTHDDNWGEIDFYDFGFATMIDKSVNAALSIIAFLLFGLGTDAVGMYKAQFRKVHPKSHSEPLSKQSTYVQNGSPTKMNSNKSQFSESTNYSEPTMHEFSDFHDVIREFGNHDDDDDDDDDEKGSETGEITKTTEYPQEDTIGVIDVDEKNLNADFVYTYEVKQKV
ncbi:uncharacterized protein LODBEIA_P26890 [Lodderomyces beijingensis]|uniref:Pheromone a factor receptor n=1 Tax=Lodderomyces beijingensis TaxID=1775926 RepID=A0ABP0ZMP1_9ASCO